MCGRITGMERTATAITDIAISNFALLAMIL